MVLYDDLKPRSQRIDFAALGGAMKLIRLLEESDTQVIVAFCGLDMLLWKAAGATHVATGKYFNLRRFIPGRWEDTSEGGRIVPYWTDDRLVTWLREDDLKLLDTKGLIDRANASSNPYSSKILEIVDAGKGEAWVGLGWRQYLYWFKQTEASLHANKALASQILVTADKRWADINDAEIYLFDRENTGNWIRPWLNALKL